MLDAPKTRNKEFFKVSFKSWIDRVISVSASCTFISPKVSTCRARIYVLPSAASQLLFESRDGDL